MNALTPDKVHAILRDCLYRTEELNGSDTPPDGAVTADGIMRRWGFNPERLASHKSEVAELLLELPPQFMQSSGGGWSFLNSCIDKDDVLWTGLHSTMEELWVLGIALGLATCQLPREIWPALPGGMPYYVVNDAACNGALQLAGKLSD